MEPNKTLSPQMRVAPLKEGEVAKFRLFGVGKVEKGREEPSTPEVYALSDREVVLDPFDENGVNQKTIGNVVTSKRVELAGGQVIMQPVTKRPQFIKGYLDVRHTENNTYSYLMRSKKNGSNKFRTRGAKVVFELVAGQKEVINALQQEDIVWAAQTIVRSANWTDLRALGTKLNESPDVRLHVKNLDDKDQAMLRLINISKQFPKVLINYSSDMKSKCKIQIYDAEAFQLLVFEPSKDTWYLNDGKQYKEVHQVSPDKSRIDSLIDFFLSEAGNGKFAEVSAALRKVLKATSGAG